MKRLGMVIMVFVVGCSSSLVGIESTIEDQIQSIEMMLGLGEIQGVQLELSNILELIDEEGLNLEDYPGIQQLITSLEESEEMIGESDHHDFSGVEAVQLAIEAYGVSDDIVYMYDEVAEHYGDDLIGYYVALKSKQLEEEGAEDPIILMLFVGEDGSIAEL